MSIENVERIDGVAQYDLIVIGSGSGNTLIGPEWDDKRSLSSTVVSSVAPA